MDARCSGWFWRGVVVVEADCLSCCVLVDQLRLEALRRMDARTAFWEVDGGQSVRLEEGAEIKGSKGKQDLNGRMDRERRKMQGRSKVGGSFEARYDNRICPMVSICILRLKSHKFHGATSYSREQRAKRPRRKYYINPPDRVDLLHHVSILSLRLAHHGLHRLP